jgi:peroxiredoxin
MLELVLIAKLKVFSDYVNFSFGLSPMKRSHSFDTLALSGGTQMLHASIPAAFTPLCGRKS